MKQLTSLASRQLKVCRGFSRFVYCNLSVLSTTISTFGSATPMPRKHDLSPASSCYGSTRIAPIKREKRKKTCLTEGILSRATAFGWNGM